MNGTPDCQCCHQGQPCECCAVHGTPAVIAMQRTAQTMYEALEIAVDILATGWGTRARPAYDAALAALNDARDTTGLWPDE